MVSVREKSKSLEVISASLPGAARSRYAWLEWDGATMSGKFLQKPEREEIPENIKGAAHRRVVLEVVIKQIRNYGNISIPET